MVYALTAPPLLPRLVALLSYVFFLGLFPVYFAYHALLSAHLIPPVMGGGWSFWTVPGAMILGALIALRRDDWRVHVPIAGLAAWVAIYAVAHALLGADFQRHPILLHESLKLVIAWVCLYGIGYFLKPDPVFTRASVGALAAMIAAALFVINPATLHDGPATYQGMATSVVFVAMVCLALCPSKGQPVILAVTLAALFAIGSRSDLLGFGFVALLWIAVEIWRKRYTNAGIGAVAGALAIAMTALWTGVLPVHMAAKPPSPELAVTPAPTLYHTAERHLELGELSKGQSAQIRIDLMGRGWGDIKSSPFAGVYGGQMRDGSAWGTYIHSILSVWRQFGLVAFLLYLGLCLAPPLLAVRQLLKGSQDPMWTLTLFIGGFSLLLVLLFKSVFWPLPALAWGLLAARVRL